jgi:hypothetical protein
MLGLSVDLGANSIAVAQIVKDPPWNPDHIDHPGRSPHGRPGNVREAAKRRTLLRYLFSKLAAD